MKLTWGQAMVRFHRMVSVCVFVSTVFGCGVQSPRPAPTESEPSAALVPTVFSPIRRDFQIEFPFQPILKVGVSEDPARKGSIETANGLVDEKEFFAIAITLPGEASKRDAQEVMRETQDAIISLHNATQVDTVQITFGPKKYPARLSTGGSPAGKHFRLVHVITGDRLFGVAVVGSKPYVDGPEAEKFLSSLRVDGHGANHFALPSPPSRR